MGVEEIPGSQLLKWDNFSSGWFPGKERQQIPKGGLSDADHVVWIEGALRKFFGYVKVNDSQLESGGSVEGLVDFTGDGHNLVGVVGTRIYEALETGTPSTAGALTVTAGNQARLVEYNTEGTNIVIGVNGVDAPWSFDGTTLQNLAGSPPTARWVEQFGTRLYMAGDTGNLARFYYSDFGLPENWDTANNFLAMTDPITGLGRLGQQLIVFKERSIATLSGEDVATFSISHYFIPDVGCVSGHSVTSGKLGGPSGRDVLFFLSHDGWYAFDGTSSVIKISTPIERKWVTGTTANQWNFARLDNAVAVHWPRFDWLVSGMSDSGDSTNDFVLMGDSRILFRIEEDDNQPAIPWWPRDGIPMNSVALHQSNNLLDCYFGDTDGNVYRFDPSLFTNDGSNYTSTATGRIEDLEQDVIVRDFVGLYDETGDTDIDMYINFDLEEGLGTQGTVNLQETADVLDSTFIMDSSVFGGKDFVRVTSDVNGTGQFLQWTIQQTGSAIGWALEQLELLVSGIGRRFVRD